MINIYVFKMFSNKSHNIFFTEDLLKRFAKTYKFCDGDINKFCQMLRKGVYTYEYMDSWETFNEIWLSDKK